MNMTIKEIIDKLEDIDRAISTIEKTLPSDCFRGQEPLCDAIDLLNEYREKIMDSKVNI